jgi:mRNA interferase RelE/StbE
LSYNVKWHEKALKDLKSLDKSNAKAIVDKVKDYLVKEPLSIGKPLKGLFKGMYRYRMGDYRVIYTVDKAEKTILILKVGARKDIYR